MSRSLQGSGAGLLIVLIGFLVLMYMTASALQSAVAGSLFGLVVVGFIALIVLILFGAKGSGRMSF